ncbi:MAG: hypothetical protein KH443_05380 [Oscillospiraceae bacterium]|nr:hypothetical protein [Oscillospiraceae bacterium]MBS6348226.1 hypothetical protein [Oscillospiraceae bacterium]
MEYIQRKTGISGGRRGPQ